MFCITFVFGVDPVIVLSNDWTLSTFPAVKGASVPCRERHSPCFIFISSHVLLSKYERCGSVTLPVHANFTLVQFRKFLPDLAIATGIKCSSWTLPIPTHGNCGTVSFLPLLPLAVHTLQSMLGIPRPSAPWFRVAVGHLSSTAAHCACLDRGQGGRCCSPSGDG